MSTIYAEVSRQGTAILETALCDEHETRENIAQHYAMPYAADPGSGVREDCSQNDALSCMVCGAEGDAIGEDAQ